MPIRVFPPCNSDDRSQVETLALRLNETGGIGPWPERWRVSPGERWPPDLDGIDL